MIALQSVFVICTDNGSSQTSPQPITESIRYKEELKESKCCEEDDGENLISGEMEICPKPRCTIDSCHNGQPEEDSNGQDLGTSNTKDIYIGGLFPLSSTTSFSKNGRSNLEAACLALEHINRQKFIPGYRLLMYYNDTQVSLDLIFNLVTLILKNN